MAKQAERREATREAIVAAATSLFGDKSFAATPMDEIATAAGVAKGAVYLTSPARRRFSRLCCGARATPSRWTSTRRCLMRPTRSPG
jgi:Bacterial regulatory proteins, tetR family